ncbi:MAG: indole-3-glycerol phosphate synthase TrpC [Thermodesulfobacteriota bacterium]
MAENILEKIAAAKKEEIAAARKREPASALRNRAEQREGQRPFIGRLRQAHENGIGIIAEIKRASPSKGIIRGDMDAGDYARRYEAGGAAAISVLTDQQFFKGFLDDLVAARKAVSLPVLRKDFLIDPYQFYEAAAAGADAALLIVRMLSSEQLTDLLALCRELRLDPLVEVHDAADLDKATAAGAELIGINNRDLKTFKTDIAVATRLVSQFRDGQVPVAASGISTADDIRATRKAGINIFLIGESIVRAEDTVGFLRGLIKGAE